MRRRVRLLVACGSVAALALAATAAHGGTLTTGEGGEPSTACSATPSASAAAADVVQVAVSYSVTLLVGLEQVNGFAYAVQIVSVGGHRVEPLLIAQGTVAQPPLFPASGFINVGRVGTVTMPVGCNSVTLRARITGNGMTYTGETVDKINVREVKDGPIPVSADIVMVRQP
jgi:hypothetical protein